MSKLLVVLGLVCWAGSASAGERWSAETCKHLQEMKATVAAMEAGAYYRAMWSIPILTHLHGKCGADNRKEFDAAMAVMVAGEPGAKNKAKASEAPPRQPMFCDTKPRALGGSTTDCF